MGKYEPLYSYLSNVSSDKLQLNYRDIEKILGFTLPKSACTHNAWWSGSKGQHPHCKSWLDAGFKVTPDLQKHTVIFYKNDKTKNIKSKATSNDNFATHSKFNPKITLQNNVLRLNVDNDAGTITLNGHTFLETSFLVEQTDIENTFLKYSSYTVEEILQKDKFRSLKQEVYQRYYSMLKLNISEFLEQLVESKDKFYYNFLNKNGADKFCVFKLTDINILNLKGLYLYTYNGKVNYIGRCKDSFGKRFNVNYGKIHPKNCFKDGQSTNTHINSLMNKYHENIKIYLLILNEDEVIERLEREFIQSLKPEWNRTN